MLGTDGEVKKAAGMVAEAFGGDAKEWQDEHCGD